MKFKINKKSLKKMYIRKNNKINLFYILLSSIIFFVMTHSGIKYNIIMYIVYYLVLLVILSIILYLFNNLYASILVKKQKKFFIKLTNNKVVSELIDINYSDIDKIEYYTNQIIIKYNHNSFIIEKSILENSTDFDKIKDILLKKTKKS